MQKSVVFLLLFLTFPALLPGQGRPDPRLRYGDLIYAEAAALPSDSVGMARVDVFVRISYDFMIFTHSMSVHPDSLFTAGVEVSYSIMQDGKTIRSQNNFARVSAGDYDSTNRRDQFVLLRQSFYLSPGDYEVAVFISDQGSTRQSTVKQTIAALLLNPDAGHIGQPIALKQEPELGEDAYSVVAYTRSLPFAEQAIIGIPIPHGLTATWNVKLIPSGDEISDSVFDDTVQPEAVLAGATPEGQSGIVSDFHLLSSPSCVGDIAILKLPFAALDVGQYRLLVTANWKGGSDSVSIPIEIFWRDMPFSMRDIEFAIDAMRFILTAEEYREMKRGDDRDMQKAFRRFWKERDATPDTEYNEMMAEYFRRVDQAYYKFQTVFERNGAQTDRGKVYVLFGPPEESQRIMKREEPMMEIWEYPSLGKTFRFVDKDHNGNFRLMEE
ncbi:MAG: GWxTD domain-containing protein [Bacteroidetes bacterium]|nr:GWxTD domain-containing protein [Bacteroidota bacterium]